ncbi:MAG: UDP-N-acetylglucosamine 4,6-dehydratase (inverting) [Myxococcales bacterium]|nr:UDP-N-acetylglucosamine 4,6-dehydratase (inverting) [Myxococcales bacterium]
MQVSEKPTQILLTGGTGSFGHAFVAKRLASDSRCTIRVFSRDELKQYEMARTFKNDPRLRFFIGDVRDAQRLQRAMYGVDLVVHAAAMKQVPICEFNPAEAVKTNINGAQNVVDAAIDSGVARCVALSTDKAVNPVNLYGATKLCAEKLFVHGNVYAGPRRSRFSCVRYGNVVGSRGSVIPLFRKQAETGVLTLTDRRMTRFWLSLGQAVDFVDLAIREMRGGEIFVPKIPSMRVEELAQVMAPNATIREMGMRPGEKLHELLLTSEEGRDAREFDSHYVIKRNWKSSEGRAVDEGFVYASDSNTQWLSMNDLRALVNEDILGVSGTAAPSKGSEGKARGNGRWISYPKDSPTAR